jgi:hypothetical protein
MKNLSLIEIKSGPTPKARAGTFIQAFGDAVLENVENPAELRNLVQGVLTQKDAYVDTITHTG